MIENLPNWINLIFILTTIATIGFFHFSNGKPKLLTTLIILWSCLFHLGISGILPKQPSYASAICTDIGSLHAPYHIQLFAEATKIYFRKSQYKSQYLSTYHSFANGNRTVAIIYS